jgi:hypothetical protein
LVKELELMIRVIGTGIGNIVQDFFANEPVTLSNC